MGESFGDELSRLQEQMRSIRALLEDLKIEEQDLTRRITAMPLAHAGQAADEDVRPSQVDLPLHSSALPPAKARALHRLLVDHRVDPRVAERPRPTADASPPASDVPPTSPDPSPVAVPRPARSRMIEQQMGGRWLQRAGIVALVLAVLFGLQHAVFSGWIPLDIQVALVALAGLALIVAGELAHHKGKPTLASGLVSGGLALLYASVFALGPGRRELFPSSVAFALMCVVTVAGLSAGLRLGAITPFALALAGFYMTPALVPIGYGAGGAMLAYIVAVDVAFLVVAAVKRWQALPLVALTGTLLWLCYWAATDHSADAAAGAVAFAWVVLLLFGAFAVVGAPSPWLHRIAAMAMVAAPATALIVMQVAGSSDLSGGSTMAQWLILDAVVLALCLYRRWDGLRAAALGWTALGLALLYVDGMRSGDVWFWCSWLWAFYGLVTLDVLANFIRRQSRVHEEIDVPIIIVSTSLMFAVTYAGLGVVHSAWLGPYTLAAAGAQLLLALAARHVRRRAVAMVYFGAALVLTLIVAPISFTLASVTVGWAVLGVAVMIPARLLRSRLLLTAAMVLLTLAVGSFLATAFENDPSLGQVMLSAGGIDVTRALTLTALLTAAAALSAALLGLGKPIWGDVEDGYLATALLWAGFSLWAWQTAAGLPVLAATWWWLALAAFVALLAAARPVGHLRGHAAAMVVVTVGKYLLFDTITQPLVGPTVLWNGQAAAAIVLALACILAARRLGRNARGPEDALAMRGLMVVLSSVIVVWGGTIEVARAIPATGDGLIAGIGQAQHAACSLWWMLCAVALLGIGLRGRMASLRYVALALFVLTFAKVFLVDLGSVDAGYRTALLAALGLTLVFASRFYRRSLQAGDSKAAGADQDVSDS